MDPYDPMSESYSYRSVENSPDIEYDVQNQQNSEFFDNFLIFDDLINQDQSSIVPVYPDYTQVHALAAIDEGSQSNIVTSSSQLQGNCSSGSGIGQAKKVTKEKVAFKTKSQIEILDDGFKWRKYGKKMVKNSPNPRNYYRCSVEGCSVKKRVERDVEDAQYVITTYEGIHNHQRPSNF